MARPAWLNTAILLLGTAEAPGSADNPVILGWAHQIGGNIEATFKHDSTAWCAYFVNYCLAASGHKGDDSLWALDFAKWGTRLSGPAVGAVFEITRDGGGHTGIVAGKDAHGNLVCVSGNVSDRVSVQYINPASVVSFNWPSDAPDPDGVGMDALPVITGTLVSDGSSAPVPPSPPATAKRQTGITATVFSSAETDQPGAYGLYIDDTVMGIALPAAFPKPRPWVCVQGPKGARVVQVIDKGPIYDGTASRPADPYWLTATRPRAELQHVKSGAGIDLTPALADAIGIDGKGPVDWWFVDGPDASTAPPATAPAPTTATPVPARGGLLLALLTALREHLMTDPATTTPPATQPPAAQAADPQLQQLVQQLVPALLQAVPQFLALQQQAHPPGSSVLSAVDPRRLAQAGLAAYATYYGLALPGAQPAAASTSRAGLGTGLVGFFGTVATMLLGGMANPITGTPSLTNVLLPVGSLMLASLGASGALSPVVTGVKTLLGLISQAQPK